MKRSTAVIKKLSEPHMSSLERVIVFVGSVSAFLLLLDRLINHGGL